MHAGNSYIESPDGRPDLDKLIAISHYERTQQQQAKIGLLAGPDNSENPQVGLHRLQEEKTWDESCKTEFVPKQIRKRFRGEVRKDIEHWRVNL